ncbi:glycosyl transferase [Ensifer sp. NM-2]|uniref:glycosyltransferase family 4 protein n=1 Tax=Ensifer TaxID=106591 RepID=UPI0007110A0F|nr:MULTISPECIES: glycosyltransferase family 4 protein [Ensifer]KQW66575.1 glycosyl transferase [Ensifer sp. Root127]NOV19706.1 glycosyltransferase [Ensifer canadensis]PSS60421.1 glycosyl transferase [Ensifer sp. NM-2]
MREQKLRVLVISHAHPSFSLGGAEIASHNLHRGLNAMEGVESVYLAAASPPLQRHASSALMSARLPQEEVLFHTDAYDHFHLANEDVESIERDLLRFVRDVKPDVIHFHHVLGFGLEALYAVRSALPDAAILLTLHEFVPICHNHGQMVKRPTGQLCEQASPTACNSCFPDIPASRFLRREALVRTMLLDMVDAFVAPSAFLAKRYAEWGVDRQRIHVIENGIMGEEATPARELARSDARRNRFAFFGQMTPFKGVDVLIDAIGRVPDEIWGDDAYLMIFGANLERQPAEFQARMKKLIERAGRRVRFYGSYQNADLPKLMRSVDWVIFPSIWWENSPVVIQEALLHRRPIICSDIGGMAEKVRDGADGLHFRAGNGQHLADRIVEVLNDDTVWDRLRSSMRGPFSSKDCAREHLGVYRSLLREKDGAAQREHRVEMRVSSQFQ